MNEDCLQRWQAFAAAWDPSAARWPTAAKPFAAAPQASGSDPYTAIAGAFAAAARAAIDDFRDSAGGRAPGIERFAEFLRAQFSDWSAFSTLGPQRQHQERWERIGEASMLAQDAQGRLGRLWSDALREAAGGFAKRCAATYSAETPPMELYDAWIDCAEEAYARIAHSEAFCSAQAALLNAQAKLRADLQTLVELWSKEMDLPTRAELNSVHLAIRALRRELAQLASRPAVAPPPPKRRRAPRAPRAPAKSDPA